MNHVEHITTTKITLLQEKLILSMVKI